MPEQVSETDINSFGAERENVWYNPIYKCPGGSIGQSKALLTLRLWVRVPPVVQSYQIRKFLDLITFFILLRKTTLFSSAKTSILLH